MASPVSCRARNPQPARLWRAFLPLLLALLFNQAASSQVYREWRDTTRPPERLPHRVDPGEFPIGIFTYTYNADRPRAELWDYLVRQNIDFLIPSVYKDAFGWNQWLNLMDSAHSGKQVMPNIAYEGQNDLPSYFLQGTNAREVIFYPFDSSQIREMGVDEHEFTFFTSDSTAENPLYQHTDTNFFREAIYNPGMANTVIASGIAFRHKPSQTERWERRDSSGTWVNNANTVGVIDSKSIFHAPGEYPWRDGSGNWQGRSRFQQQRMPHYIVMTGHLFEFGAAANGDTLLRINVWYEVNEGETYYDSSGVLQTAGDNHRFLYKTLGVTRGELYPTNPTEPVWNEYREAVKRINFRREGMGGPTDTLVTAQSIDLEVIYLGGEKLALRSVAIRDSIANLLMTPGTPRTTFLTAVRREIDTLVRDTSGDLRDAIFTLFYTDEPKPEEYAGFFEIKKSVEQEMTFLYPNGDTLSGGNGTANPHLPHLGKSDWTSHLTYFGASELPLYNWNDQHGVAYSTPPSALQHNGGRFGIPLLFDLTALGSGVSMTTARLKIDTLEDVFQRMTLGASLTTANWPMQTTKLFHIRNDIGVAQRTGTRMNVHVGPTSDLMLRYESGVRDTLADHRPEPSEVRCLSSIALAYGAKMLTWYTLESLAWYGTAADGGPIGFNGLGVGGHGVWDTTANIIDWPLYRNVGGRISTSDSIGVIPDYYLGFESLYHEMRAVNTWAKRIGPLLTRLNWRDGYSVHWQQRRPKLPGDTVNPYYPNDMWNTPRPLPSAEIVNCVLARHPITNALDSAWTTYSSSGCSRPGSTRQAACATG